MEEIIRLSYTVALLCTAVGLVMSVCTFSRESLLIKVCFCPPLGQRFGSFVLPHFYPVDFRPFLPQPAYLPPLPPSPSL